MVDRGSRWRASSRPTRTEIGLTDEQIRRYSRHILLPEVGGAGQERLLDSSVLVVGAGGLGSPVGLYLAAAGVGRIGVADGDVVDLTNLQRQIAHGTPDVDRPKVESFRESLARVNPGVRIEVHDHDLDPENVRDIVAGYDVVLDGTDNFPTRYLLNDACRLAGRPLVSGAVLRFEGQLTVFEPGGGRPCYRCLFRSRRTRRRRRSARTPGCSGRWRG
jgi:molybdopterin/thiamine biosynthesis adenylyltransferase